LLNQRNKRPLSIKAAKTRAAYIAISPFIIGFVVFWIYPLVSSLVFSFTNYSFTSDWRFVGMKNYLEMFTRDPTFYKSISVTLIYVLVAIPAKIGFALFVAVLLCQRVKGINVFRTVFYIPSIMGASVAISILWRFIFKSTGMMNRLLAVLGLPPVEWLGVPALALGVLASLTVWQFGSSMIIFLAGLKQIPVSLYESAEIDGASKRSIFARITLPMLAPLVLFNLIMQTINGFKQFTSAYIITDGGPLHATYLYGLKLYDEGFQYFKMGYACGLSWILFFIILGFTLLIFNYFRSRIYFQA
jgi:oligogalacturonide transport system permease protein